MKTKSFKTLSLIMLALAVGIALAVVFAPITQVYAFDGETVAETAPVENKPFAERVAQWFDEYSGNFFTGITVGGIIALILGIIVGIVKSKGSLWVKGVLSKNSNAIIDELNEQLSKLSTEYEATAKSEALTAAENAKTEILETISAKMDEVTSKIKDDNGRA